MITETPECWDELSALADRFQAATPELLQARLLQKRFDRKYVLSACALPDLLEKLQDTHQALPGSGPRLAEYSTDYLDTALLDSFHDHRRGRPRRMKVRLRSYPDRDLEVLEVKHRTGRGTTDKDRINRRHVGGELTPAEQAWLAEHADPRAREPSLRTVFRRLTLLGRHSVERLTIDTCLVFSRGTSEFSLPNLAIVEVKTPKPSQRGTAVRWLHQRGLRPFGFSKYCVGLVLVDDALPRHRFAPSIRRARRVGAA